MAELHILPTSIIAGESITATITGLDVSGFSLSYQFSATTPFSVDCVANGDSWELTVTPAQTLTMKAGIVRFAALLTNTTEGTTQAVDYGTLAVAASPLTVSQYEAALVAVDAAILGFAGNVNKRLSLGTMSVEYRSLDELLNLRYFYVNEIAKEKSGRSGGPFIIGTRFR